MRKRDSLKRRSKRIGETKMTDPEKTDPNWKAKIQNWTAKADPKVDRVLESAKASAYTPWLIVGAVVVLIVLAVIVAK